VLTFSGPQEPATSKAPTFRKPSERWGTRQCKGKFNYQDKIKDKTTSKTNHHKMSCPSGIISVVVRSIVGTTNGKGGPPAVAGGSVVGGMVGDAIKPPATRGFWSIARDLANFYDKSKGNVSQWLGTGPDAAAAAGATGAIGAGAAVTAKDGC
jgi:hypothetical protein